MRKLNLLLIFSMLILVSCGDDIDEFVPDPIPENVTASVFGLVVDTDQNPVENAEVELEGYIVYTNALGAFQILNKKMSKDAYVTIEKDGFFEGSRRFYPKNGGKSQVKVMLLEDATVYEFASSTGGLYEDPSGMKLNFPADAIQTASGVPYNGQVLLSMNPIRSDDPNVSDKMPGDLVGISENSELQVLGTYGMMAVELRSPSGEQLNIRSGMTAELSMQVPADQLNSAPSLIPLWFFDEDQGFWVEEGSALLNGDTYVGQVSHFSFWNCDAPFPLIELEGIVVSEEGQPLSGITIKITIISSNLCGYAWLNDAGEFGGKVAKDELLLLEVKDQCGNTIYSEQIGPFSSDVILEPITIGTTNPFFVVMDGSLVNCDGDPVSNGFVQIDAGFSYKITIPVDENGIFNYQFFNCNELGQVTVQGYDEDALKESLPITVTAEEVITLGPIEVCEDLTESIVIETSVDTVTFLAPEVQVNTDANFITLNAWQDSTQTGGSLYFFVSIPGSEPGTYTDVSAQEVFLNLGFGQWGSMNDVIVEVTFVGEPGDFVAGTISGNYKELDGNDSMDYPFEGTFQVLRE